MRLWLLGGLIALWCGAAQAAPPAVAPASAASSSVDRAGVESASIEREKMVLERDKLALEQQKTWITAAAIGVPIIVALLTVLTQVKSALRVKQLETAAAFELKAAELVLAGYSPYAGQGRARVLQGLFPHRLPETFAGSFDISVFPGTRLHDMKLELLRALAAAPGRRATILRDWQSVFPDEAWLKSLN